MATATRGCRQDLRERDDRGVAAASSLAVIASVVVLAAALVGFVASGRPPAKSPAMAGPHPVAVDKTPTARHTDRTPHSVRKRHVPRHDSGGKQPASHHPRPVPGVYVEVFNDGGSSGLAASVAARLQAVGWQVVGTDDWYGNIPASTVYYPSSAYQAAARRLAKAVGIERVWPAVSPMHFDRLTVILTSDYSG